MNPRQYITPANLRAAQALRRVPFPHMGPMDTRVWQAALKLGLVKFDRVEYDVRLGGAGADLVAQHEDHKTMWETLLRKRVDVVGHRGKDIYVIEVKPVAGHSALGQCISYRDLWSKEKPGAVKPRAMCVCALADPDLAPIYSTYGVDVVVLPPGLADDVLSGRA